MQSPSDTLFPVKSITAIKAGKKGGGGNEGMSFFSKDTSAGGVSPPMP